MESTQLLTEIQQKLGEASPEQIKWVLARLTCKTDKEAARVIGMNHTSVSKWPNKSELDKTVRLLLIDPLIAAAETLRLAAPEAAAVLVRELAGRHKRQAANDVLDRAGIARLSKVAPTTPDGQEEYDPTTTIRTEILSALHSISQASAEKEGN